jgi:hypothetical protein
MTLATHAGADVVDKSFSFKGKKFYVMLHDNAREGCWTNLRKTREYAEEKLKMKGATLKEAWDSNTFLLEIEVVATRNPNADSQCFGMIRVCISDMMYYKEPNKRLALVSENNYALLHNKNMNTQVLDRISVALAEFE